MSTLNKLSDERRAAIAIFLSILVIFAYNSIFVQPPSPVTTQGAEPASSVDAPKREVQTLAEPSSILPNKMPVSDIVSATNKITHADYLKSPSIDIDSSSFQVSISTLGGKLTALKLNNYRKEVDGDELVNLVMSEGASLPLTVSSGSIDDSMVSYQLSGISSGIKKQGGVYKLEPGQALSFVLTGKLANGSVITKNFEFQADKYLFDVKVSLDKPVPDGSNLWLSWSRDISVEHENNRYNPDYFEFLDNENSVDREMAFSPKDEYPEKIINWIGFGNNYFFNGFISPEKPVPARIKVLNNKQNLNLMIAGSPQSISARIFAGPKDPGLLQNTGYDLHRSIDFGWFSFFGSPLLKLINFCYKILGNYGLAIILVTILLKLVLLPLTKTSLKSMKGMQEIQPEIQALRERVKDPAVVQQEMLAIYKRHGVNPMGGCLPMVLQIPIFLGMYNALRTSVYLRHADFALWINDLSAPEKLVLFGIPVPVMIIVMGLTMFLQTLTTPSTADPNQKKIMYMMPVMFTIMFIILPFPSGLVLYWLVNNLISVIQQYVLKSDKEINPYKATIVGGIVVFGIGYVFTLL